MSTGAGTLRWAVRAYQHLRSGRVSPCRFQPTCSAYADEAIAVHGARRGAWLALRRIVRCRPWGGHGWDPVPPAFTPGSAEPRHERSVA